MTAAFPVHRRMILLTEGASSPSLAKTAINLLRYRGPDVVAVLDSQNAGRTAQELFGTGGATPVVAQLHEADGPDSLVIGIAPPGGRIPQAWHSILEEAIRRRLDVVSGLHDFLATNPELAALADHHGVRLIDVRRNNECQTSDCLGFRPGCLRIHTVGQDCSVGKMVVALEVQRELSARGLHAGFAATGQTGIMIAGTGVPIDCVVSDFVNGAAERLVRSMDHYDYVLVEGQGCITHPRYSAVTLGLLHGCAPDGLIMCYEVGRNTVKSLDHVPLRSLSELIRLNEDLANARHPCRVIGIAMNSRRVTADEAEAERERMRQEFGLPVCDVLRHGAAELADASIRLKAEVGTCS